MRNFIVTIDGKSYSVGVEEVGAAASAAPVVAAPEVKPATPAPATVQKGEKVVSPFPGLIKKLSVAEGTAVKKDQPIIVLEAMKMDNEITAPCDGKVYYKVAKGANVETDTLLAVIG